jgi:S-adenosylmethionine:tRNA ribosyltransferase-isomerase
MRIGELDYELPRELIAQSPLRNRTGSRLLVLEREAGRLRHGRFSQIAEHLAPRSVLVLNDTRVFPARLAGTKTTGGRLEVLLTRRTSGAGRRERWLALCSGSGRLRPGTRASCGDLDIEIADRADGGLFEVVLGVRVGTVRQAVDGCGRVPLPPYIDRPATPDDADRYQTVYARRRGSAAAPTAGLHFTHELLDALRGDGHAVVTITLHVGPGTFQPVREDRVEDHHMHEEWVHIGRQAARSVCRAHERGRRIVACGTTVVRALEAAADGRGGIREWDGPVDLFIRPGHPFTVVDDLVTNFHLPRSTLLALVMALAGTDLTRDAYQEAVRERYRFYSYGDAMLIAR